MQVSSWELEELIQIARNHGAVGAKLTGGGGGGSIIALCPDNSAGGMAKAIRAAGYHALEVTIRWHLSRPTWRASFRRNPNH